MTKGRMVVERPRFDEWTCKFEIVSDIDDLPEERIKEIIDFAGMYVGVGDWRPAKKGKYGKFIVTEFKAI